MRWVRFTSLDGGDIEYDPRVSEIAFTRRILRDVAHPGKSYTEVWLKTEAGVQFGFRCGETHETIDQRLSEAKASEIQCQRLQAIT